MYRVPIFLAFMVIGQAEAAEPVSERDVVFASPDKTDLQLDFVRPAGDGPFPLIVFVHGGGWQIGSRAEYREAQTGFAKFGFASATVQYRFAPKHRFPAQLDDVTAAIRFMADAKKRFRIDPERIGLMGGSAGGHLSLLAGFTDIPGCKILAVVNVAGPTDLRTFQSDASGDAALKGALKRDSAGLLEDLLGSKDREAKVYATASPVVQIRKGGPAILSLHGTADNLVPLSQAESFHVALKKAGITQRLKTVKGGGHDFAAWPEKERTAALLDVFAFFKEHLKAD